MKHTLIIFFITTFAGHAFDLNKIKLVDCYDGDTCKFKILDSNFPDYLNPMSIRLLGVDTPELKNKNLEKKKLAYKAKEFTLAFVKNANNLQLKNCIKDKYFRFDCEFVDGGKSLGEELLRAGLGVPYFGGTKGK